MKYEVKNEGWVIFRSGRRIGKGLKTKKMGPKMQLMTYDLEKRGKLEFCQEMRMVKYGPTLQ